jgi:hypothetical protein
MALSLIGTLKRQYDDTVMRRLHRGLGLLVLFAYFYAVTHLANLLPGLQLPQMPLHGLGLRGGNPGAGWMVIFGLPLISVTCYVWPDQLMWHLSPRLPPNYDYLFTPGVWYLLGYTCLILGVSVSLLFR